jgi:peptidoglycan hydrolase-like protein with peptidoglycan-binding domain
MPQRKEIYVVYEKKELLPIWTVLIMNLTRNLRRGMEGGDVWTVKIRLFELGYYAPHITALKRKRFGSDTRRAVIAFQEANRLVPDGVVGPVTYGALFLENTAAVETTDSAAVTAEFPDRGEVPGNIGREAAAAIWYDLLSASQKRRRIVIDALQFAFDPAVPAEYPLSLYIRGGNLYNKDLTLNVITQSRIASGAQRQPEYYDGGRREMMEAAVAANPSTTGADCSGGVVGLLRHARVVPADFDFSANSLVRSSVVRTGKTGLLCADFIHKSGHIGLYAGGGYVIEWMGGAFGCQLSRLDDRRGWNFVKGKLERRSAWTDCFHPTYY